MVEILAGGIGGIVSALGMGGGTILIVILSIFLGMDQHKAQGTNMVFFIPTAITAIILNIKNKNINFNLAKIICAFGIIGAILGATVSINLDTNTLKKLYGIFLAIIAIYEILGLIKMHKKDKNM